jgi:hypothetical protein
MRFGARTALVIVLGGSVSSRGAVATFALQEKSEAPANRAGEQLHDVASLVQALKRPDVQALTAVTQLGGMPAEEVLPRLLAAMSADPAFREKAHARARAFEVLATTSSTTADGKKVIRIAEQVDALGHGLEDPNENVRCNCARALGRVSDEHHAKVVKWLRLKLRDPGMIVVTDAAQSLGAIGKAAEPALPELLSLLENPSEERRGEWERAIGAYSPPSAGDMEVLLRGSCAEARMVIAGIGVDVERARTLDRRGQQAYVEAMRGRLGRAIVFNEPHPEVIASETQSALCDWCRFYLVEAHDADSEARASSAGMLMWFAVSDRVGDDVREKARRALEGAVNDADPRVSGAVKSGVELLRKKK